MKYLISYTNNSALSNAPDTTRLSDLGLDSLSLFEFILGLEDEFGIAIDDHSLHADRFRTIGDTLAFLENTLQTP